MSSEDADLGRWRVQDQPVIHSKNEASLGHTKVRVGSMTQRQMDKDRWTNTAPPGPE